MKNILKISLIVFFALLMLFFFKNRYLSPFAGVNSSVGDFSAHLNISEHLTNKDIFPSFDQQKIGAHATSRYLPIYHGILGFHTLSLFWESLGVPRPGAYALTNDISLLLVTITFIFLIIDSRKKNNIPELIASSFIFFPVFFNYFTKSVNAGFYSLLLSQALIAMGVYLFSKNWKKTAWVLFLYAFFSYPDSLIWFIPLLVIAYPKGSFYGAIVLIPLWVTMMAVPLTRGALMGDFTASLIPWCAVISYLLLFFPEIFRKDKKLVLTTVIFSLYSTVLLVSTQHYYNLSYYGVKLSSFSYLLLPYLLITVPISQTRRGRLFLAILLYFMLSSGDLWSQYSSDYFGNHSTFNNQDFASARTMQNEIDISSCKKSLTYVIPSFGNKSDPNILTSFNSLLINYDLYSLEINSEGFRELVGVQKEVETYAQFIRTVRKTEVMEWIRIMEERIRIFSPKLDFCLGVSKEDSTHFAKSQYFEKIYAGEQFVYFKPKKP